MASWVTRILKTCDMLSNPDLNSDYHLRSLNYNNEINTCCDYKKYVNRHSTTSDHVMGNNVFLPANRSLWRAMHDSMDHTPLFSFVH